MDYCKKKVKHIIVKILKIVFIMVLNLRLVLGNSNILTSSAILPIIIEIRNIAIKKHLIFALIIMLYCIQNVLLHTITKIIIEFYFYLKFFI